MGKILNLKSFGKDKVRCELEISYEESLQLGGRLKQVYIFSDEPTIENIKTSVIVKGSHGSSKYLLIPKTLRKNLKLPEKVTCCRLDFPEKIFFIYSIEKR